MADDIVLNLGSGGSTLRTDDVSAKQYPFNKIAYGADGSATHVENSAPFPVRSMRTVAHGGMAIDPGLAEKLYLSQDGLDSTFNANGDYSAGAVRWHLEPPAATHYLIKKLTLYAADSAVVDLAANTYLGIAALTNGITVTVNDIATDAVNHTLVGADVPVKQWRHWAIHSTDPMELHNGTAATVAKTQIDLMPIFGSVDVFSPSGGSGEYLCVNLNDDFSTIDEHYFLAHVLVLTTANFDANYTLIT